MDARHTDLLGARARYKDSERRLKTCVPGKIVVIPFVGSSPMPEGFASLVLHIIRNYGGEKGITLTSIYKEIKGAGSWNIGGETWIVPKSFSRSALERSVWGLHEISHSIERLGKPHEYHYKIASVKEKN